MFFLTDDGQKNVSVGAPAVEGVLVSAKILEQPERVIKLSPLKKKEEKVFSKKDWPPAST